MKHKLKKIFENAVWWSGVITVGIVLGISLQIVKAWTEPATAPPGGNVGAPINTSDVGQAKWGALQVLGFTLFNDADQNDDGIVEPENDVTGKVLTAYDANGATAWAAGSGGGGDSYTAWGTNACAANYSAAYTGVAIFAAGAGDGLSNTICSKDRPTSVWAIYSWFSGAKWSQNKELDCAVCVKI